MRCGAGRSSDRPPAWRRNPAGSAGAHRRLSPDEVEGCAQFDVDESHGLLPMRSLSRSVGSPVRAGELIAAAASGFVLRRWWVPVVAVPAVVRAPGAAGRSGVGVDRHGRGHDTDAELGPTILAATGGAFNRSLRSRRRAERTSLSTQANVTSMTSARRRSQPCVRDPEGRIRWTGPCRARCGYETVGGQAACPAS
jgi:hypothetical protein